MHGQHYANLQDTNGLKISTQDLQKWGIYHFFDTRCACSRNILKNLLKRSALSSSTMHEKIFYYGDLSENLEQLRQLGYPVEKVNFKQLGVTGVPLLVVFDPQKTIRYAGGYSDRAINPLQIPNEKKLIQNIIQQKHTDPYPVIGCAVSKEYQKLLDPLGLKYGSVTN
jgi:hypothetical protein